MQRLSGEELKSLMRDVGGEDMAIQFPEFEEVSENIHSCGVRGGEESDEYLPSAVSCPL